MEQRNPRPLAFIPLDEVHRAILEALTADARIKTAELGRRVRLSAPAVAERLRRLEESGVVSYRTEVDPRALGYTISAITKVSPATRDLPWIPETAKAIPQITGATGSPARTATS